MLVNLNLKIQPFESGDRIKEFNPELFITARFPRLREWRRSLATISAHKLRVGVSTMYMAALPTSGIGCTRKDSAPPLAVAAGSAALGVAHGDHARGLVADYGFAALVDDIVAHREDAATTL